MGSPAVLQFFMQFADRARSRFLFLFFATLFLPSLPPSSQISSAHGVSFKFSQRFHFLFFFSFLHVTRGDFATLRKQEKNMCPEPEGAQSAGSLCVPQVGAAAPPCPALPLAQPVLLACPYRYVCPCVRVCVCVTAFFFYANFFLLIFYAPRACVCVPCPCCVASYCLPCLSSSLPLLLRVFFFFSAWVSCFLTVSFLGGGQDFPKI